VKRRNVGILLCTFLLMAMGCGLAITAMGSIPNEPSTEKAFYVSKAYKEIGDTKADINGYKSKMAGKIAQIQEKLSPEENVLVTITFNHPIEKDALTNLINENDLQVKTILGRTIENGTGLRGTIQLASQDRKLYDEEVFEHMVSSNNAVFKGFIEIAGYVKVKNIDQLAHSQFVFLVDPSADNHLVSNPKKKTMPGVFWKLEDNDLVVPSLSQQSSN